VTTLCTMAKTQKTNENFRKYNTADNKKRRALLAQAKAVQVIERRYQVVELKRDGYTHKEIADRLGISIKLVSEDLNFVLNETIEEYKLTTEQERLLQNQRLDQLLKTFTPLATEPRTVVVVDRQTREQRVVEVPPDAEYARLILSIEDRRSRLNGLDAPTKIEADVTAIRRYEGIDLSKV